MISKLLKQKNKWHQVTLALAQHNNKKTPQNQHSVCHLE